MQLSLEREDPRCAGRDESVMNGAPEQGQKIDIRDRHRPERRVRPGAGQNLHSEQRSSRLCDERRPRKASHEGGIAVRSEYGARQSPPRDRKEAVAAPVEYQRCPRDAVVRRQKQDPGRDC